MQVEARLVNKDSLNKNNSLDLASSICTISQDHSSLFIIVVNLVFVISLRCIDWVREPLCEQNVIYIFSIKNCIGTESEQGRIQDFRNGGSDLLRGVRFVQFTQFSPKNPHENEIFGTKRGVRLNTPNPLWIRHWWSLSSVNFCPFSLPLGVRNWLRFVIVALPGLF